MPKLLKRENNYISFDIFEAKTALKKIIRHLPNGTFRLLRIPFGNSPCVHGKRGAVVTPSRANVCTSTASSESSAAAAHGTVSHPIPGGTSSSGPLVVGTTGIVAAALRSPAAILLGVKVLIVVGVVWVNYALDGTLKIGNCQVFILDGVRECVVPSGL